MIGKLKPRNLPTYNLAEQVPHVSKLTNAFMKTPEESIRPTNTEAKKSSGDKSSSGRGSKGGRSFRPICDDSDAAISDI